MSSITHVNSADHVTVNCTSVRLHHLRTQSMDVVPSKDHVRQKCLPHTARTKPSRLPIGTASDIKPSTRDIRLLSECGRMQYPTRKLKTSQLLAKARSCASRDLSLGGASPMYDGKCLGTCQCTDLCRFGVSDIASAGGIGHGPIGVTPGLDGITRHKISLDGFACVSTASLASS